MVTGLSAPPSRGPPAAGKARSGSCPLGCPARSRCTAPRRGIPESGNPVSAPSHAATRPHPAPVVFRTPSPCSPPEPATTALPRRSTRPSCPCRCLVTCRVQPCGPRRASSKLPISAVAQRPPARFLSPQSSLAETASQATIIRPFRPTWNGSIVVLPISTKIRRPIGPTLDVSSTTRATQHSFRPVPAITTPPGGAHRETACSPPAAASPPRVRPPCA